MIWILGGSGYVGQAFQRCLAARGRSFRSVARRELDYFSRDRLLEALRLARPDYLINCAGYTGKPNVDAAEDHKAECLAGNAVLPGILAEACAAAGVRWGHVSSGCIYSGARPDGSGFREDDAPNFTFRSPPCSFYSGSKALGEEVLAGRPGVLLWRLRIPFNGTPSPRNFLTKLLTYPRLLEARNSLSQLDDFARACWESLERGLPDGTYNVTNPGSITTREVVALIERTGVARRAWDFFQSEDEFMARAARTPRSNCVLDPSKILAAGIHLAPVAEAVEAALRSYGRA